MAAAARQELIDVVRTWGLERVPVPQLVTDRHGVILHANGLAAELLGVRPIHFLVGKPIASYVASEERRRFRVELARLPAAGGGRLRVGLRPRSDRDYRVEAWVGVEVADTGPILYWVIHDTTEQAQAEAELMLLNAELESRVAERTQELGRTSEALALEEARFAAVFEQMPGGVLIAEAPSGRIVLANAYAVDLFGESILSARVGSDEVRPYTGSPRRGDPYEPSEWPLARALFRGETINGELVEIKHGDRPVLVLEASSAPVRNPRGEIVAAVLAFHDVTAREERERIEREFIQNAAHQLRTPLTAITSTVAVLQAGASEDPIARGKFLDHIARESDRLARLTRSLLVLARAQTAQERPVLEPVELEPLLRRVAESLDVAPDVDVKLSCHRDLAALANRDLAEEALASVAGNSAKYTTNGTIALRAARDGRRSVVVEVSDTGPGIPEEFRPRLFDRFARGAVDGSHGFGLGLAIASQAVTAMGGALEIDSELGKGTTARLTLKAAR